MYTSRNFTAALINGHRCYECLNPIIDSDTYYFTLGGLAKIMGVTRHAVYTKIKRLIKYKRISKADIEHVRLDSSCRTIYNSAVVMHLALTEPKYSELYNVAKEISPIGMLLETYGHNALE